MSSAERRDWDWSGSCNCKDCARRQRIEKANFERERLFYKKAKEELYPRGVMKERLKRIESDRTWEGTASFYESWRLPSSLQYILQPFVGERKDTGFVEAESQPNDQAGGHAAGVDAGRLESLEKSMEYVEEQDLSDSSDNDDSIRAGSLRSGQAYTTTSFKHHQHPVAIAAG